MRSAFFDRAARRFRRAQWLADSLGFVPRKLPSRLGLRRGPRVLATSVPKSGTFLLERALCLHPDMYRQLRRTVFDSQVRSDEEFRALIHSVLPGQVAMTHVAFSPAYPEMLGARGVKTVLMVRDPRDIVLSHAHYAATTERHWLFRRYREADPMQRLRMSIEGIPDAGLRSVGETLRVYEGWLEAADLVVRFEDLVGDAGGGDDRRQRKVLDDLYRVLGVDRSQAILDHVQPRVFSRYANTFRRGSVGQWREAFDDSIADLFQRVAGEELVRYGYEV